MKTSGVSPATCPIRGSKEGSSRAKRRDERVVNDVEVTKNISSSKSWPQEISFVAR
jgi:hypothetical protein